MTEPDILIDRPSSLLRREVRDGQAVYFKVYSASEHGRTTEVVRARTAREADLLSRLTASDRFRGRLGVPCVISVDSSTATIVTAEIPGQPLENVLVGPYAQRFARKSLQAIWLAGRWLRSFEETEVLTTDLENISPHEPVDLVEYCAVRLQNIRDAGYRWPKTGQSEDILRRLQIWLDAAFASERNQIWCHGDFAPGNMMWDGCRLTAIDFAMARVDLPLIDATYFLHRLEMMAVYFPWKRWPLVAWKRAFLAGYGRPGVENSPLWQAQHVRHLLCRLQTYVRRPTIGKKQSLHRVWILRCLRGKLEQALDDISTSRARAAI